LIVLAARFSFVFFVLFVVKETLTTHSQFLFGRGDAAPVIFVSRFFSFSPKVKEDRCFFHLSLFFSYLSSSFCF